MNPRALVSALSIVIVAAAAIWGTTSAPRMPVHPESPHFRSAESFSGVIFGGNSPWSAMVQITAPSTAVVHWVHSSQAETELTVHQGLVFAMHITALSPTVQGGFAVAGVDRRGATVIEEVVLDVPLLVAPTGGGEAYWAPRSPVSLVRKFHAATPSYISTFCNLVNVPDCYLATFCRTGLVARLDCTNDTWTVLASTTASTGAVEYPYGDTRAEIGPISVYDMSQDATVASNGLWYVVWPSEDSEPNFPPLDPNLTLAEFTQELDERGRAFAPVAFIDEDGDGDFDSSTIFDPTSFSELTLSPLGGVFVQPWHQ
jgi:hypothetical protein